MRKKEGETAQEIGERLKNQNLGYQKRRALGWRHPKDKVGANTRVIRGFMKGALSMPDMTAALRRDAGFPSTKFMTEANFFSFKNWLKGPENAEE